MRRRNDELWSRLIHVYYGAGPVRLRVFSSPIVTGFGTQSTRRNGHMIYVKIYENISFTTKHDRKLEADGKVPAGDIVFAITYFN